MSDKKHPRISIPLKEYNTLLEIKKSQSPHIVAVGIDKESVKKIKKAIKKEKGKLLKFDILNKVLTREEQAEILGGLFGFSFNGDGVLLDSNINEFYSFQGNAQFDFSTLAGIFSYMAFRMKNQGYSDCQAEFRKLLGS